MKSAANRYLDRIASQVGERDTHRAVQVFVRGQRTAQESLDALAHKLGVSEITEERLPFEGGLFRLEDGRLVIKLNTQSSFARKRFTLAHEIAHLLIGAVPGFRKAHGSDPALERACDSIAAELLMPSDEAVEFVRRLGSPSPEKLRVIADKYAVSLHTAAIRVHDDFRIWKCFVGFWERYPNIKTIWFVGQRRWDAVEPDSYSLELALSTNKSIRSGELWRRGPVTDPVALNLLHIGNSRVLGLVGFVN
jgi:IrrE N-terminal-like domain